MLPSGFGGAPGASAYGAGMFDGAAPPTPFLTQATPMLGMGGATPMHGSQTPMHGGLGGMTPLHGGMTPLHHSGMTPLHGGGGGATPLHGTTPMHDVWRPDAERDDDEPERDAFSVGGSTPHAGGQTPIWQRDDRDDAFSARGSARGTPAPPTPGYSDTTGGGGGAFGHRETDSSYTPALTGSVSGTPMSYGAATEFDATSAWPGVGVEATHRATGAAVRVTALSADGGSVFFAGLLSAPDGGRRHEELLDQARRARARARAFADAANRPRPPRPACLTLPPCRAVHAGLPEGQAAVEGYGARVRLDDRYRARRRGPARRD